MSRVLAVAAVALAVLACRRQPPARFADDVPPPPIDEAALDRTVQPCDDFYLFACGGWLGRTEIPADRAAWFRSFDGIQERTERQVRRILDAAAAGRLDGSDPFARKFGDFWASCLDEASVEAQGLADLRAEWARVDAIPDRPALADEIGRLAAAGVFAPFFLHVDQDARNATETILVLGQEGLSLPDRDYWLSADPRSAEIRARFGLHLRRMLGLAAVPAAEVEAQAVAIEGFERALAEAHWTRVEMREPSRIYNRVDRAGLEALAPAFPWARFFAGIGRPDLSAVSVTTPRFVSKVGSLVEEGALDAWKVYLRWRLLAAMAEARALPRAFVDERFAFESASFTGAKAQRERWKDCVDHTDAAAGFAVGRAYVTRHFGAEAKDRTSRLVLEIESAMGRDIDELAWMDAATKERARAKLGRVVNKIGYPDAWRDYSALRVDRGSYFRNVLAAARFETSRKLAKVGAPVDRGEWLLTPPTVNAYYNASMNEMVFPAAILQPPWWNREAPEAVNYGAVGMVVGHELTHGFDDEGRQYDGEGNLRDWWSPGVSREFETRAACVAEQYGRYEPVPGVKLDGKLTLGENIADLGGLELAFAAMRTARAVSPDTAGGALQGFTPEQQFFVGYAQAWCAKERDEHLRLMAVTNAHSPARFRVNGPLVNMAEFGEAFECAPGSAMVRPEGERCELW